MEFPKKLIKGELEALFQRAKFYPVDIKQKFWALGYHIKALEAEIKALHKQIADLRQQRLEEDKHQVIPSLKETETQVKTIHANSERTNSTQQNQGMFKPSGVTREQIAHTLWKRRHATAKDEQAYNGFVNLHGISDDTMKEMAESWERKKYGSSES